MTPIWGSPAPDPEPEPRDLILVAQLADPIAVVTADGAYPWPLA